jgi:hypothetical protein
MEGPSLKVNPYVLAILMVAAPVLVSLWAVLAVQGLSSPPSPSLIDLGTALGVGGFADIVFLLIWLVSHENKASPP